MYQAQLINLLQEFHLTANQRFILHRLLNDTEYRNQSLQRAKTQVSKKSHSKMLLLINQIERLEDLLHHELQVDLLTQVPNPHVSTQRWGLAALAFSCLLFIAGSVLVVEEVNHQRLISQLVQTD